MRSWRGGAEIPGRRSPRQHWLLLERRERQRHYETNMLKEEEQCKYSKVEGTT